MHSKKVLRGKKDLSVLVNKRLVRVFIQYMGFVRSGMLEL